jgi:hypothetical protein
MCKKPCPECGKSANQLDISPWWFCPTCKRRVHAHGLTEGVRGGLHRECGGRVDPATPFDEHVERMYAERKEEAR